MALEIPNPILLNMAASEIEMQSKFSAQLEAVHDVVCYGSNLIVRCLPKYRETSFDRIVVVGTLLKQVVSMLDGASILLQKGSSYVAQVQTRAAFEASLYIAVILKEDPVYRSRVYRAAEMRRDRLYVDDILDYKNKFIGIRKEMGDDYVDGLFGSEEVQSMAVKNRLTIIEQLSHPDYCEIDRLFDNTKKGKYEPFWYSCLGYRSIQSMAEEFGQFMLYDRIYESGSKVIHGKSLRDQLKSHEAGVYLNPIRNIGEAHTIVANAVSIALQVYRLVVEHYRPAEIGQLKQHYIDHWQAVFLGNHVLSYDFEAS